MLPRGSANRRRLFRVKSRLYAAIFFNRTRFIRKFKQVTLRLMHHVRSTLPSCRTRVRAYRRNRRVHVRLFVKHFSVCFLFLDELKQQ